MDQQDVPVSPSRDRLIDGMAEESLEKAMLAAADHDQVGVAPLGDGEQPLGGLAHLRHVLGLDVAARKRHLGPIELTPRKRLRVQ